MKFKNGWSSLRKQWDKAELKVRISALTIFELNIDISQRNLKIMILNFGIKF